MMSFTDTHIHLYAEEFDSDRETLILEAIQEDVGHFYLPNIDSSSIDGMLRLEKQFPQNCFAMMGLHPCSVKENWKEEMKIVESWLEKRKFVAIGEMGIDLYWDKTFVEEQKEVFRQQILLANQYSLPVVIHSRDSFEMIYELLQERPKEGPCGIFHCFTGNADQAQRAIDLGFYLGIGGVLTFKNSGLDKVVENIDLRHLVLETDAPYLAPTPFRGKRNIPVYLKMIAEKLAMIHGKTLEEIGKITSENATKIFTH